MSKKMVSKEKIVTEMNLLKSKAESNQLHLKELQMKSQRLNKSMTDLTSKLNQQKKRYEELKLLLASLH